MTTIDFVVAIPARYAASRLPGKPLRLIGGEPMVLHVARRALAAGAREVWVATDDERIADALDGSGVRVAMTSADHQSGTDRLAECSRIAGWGDDTIVVNLQGDEPFAPADGIACVARTVADSGAGIATLAAPIYDIDTLLDPNAVKVVLAANGDALYFSRAPVPWPRDAFAKDRSTMPHGRWLRHIGIYGYRASALRAFAALRVATPGSVAGSGGWPALAELMASTSHRFAEAFLWDEVLARFDEPRRRGLAMLHALGGADDELLSAAMDAPVDVVELVRFVPMTGEAMECDR